MLAFSGCYYGGGEKERRELGAIRKRWKGLRVCMLLCYHMLGILKTQIEFCNATSAVLYFSLTQRKEEDKVDAH